MIDNWKPAENTSGFRLEDGAEILRGRSPDYMMPLILALQKQRGLLTWLIPHERCVGYPSFAPADALALTIVDDLDLTACGPSSFDMQTLLWWKNHIKPQVIDAGPWLRDPKPIVMMLRLRTSVLLVHTPESRRLSWQKFLWGRTCSPASSESPPADDKSA